MLRFHYGRIFLPLQLQQEQYYTSSFLFRRSKEKRRSMKQGFHRHHYYQDQIIFLPFLLAKMDQVYSPCLVLQYHDENLEVSWVLYYRSVYSSPKYYRGIVLSLLHEFQEKF